MTEQLQMIDIKDHPLHGDFQVEVPQGYDTSQIQEYVGTLDLDLLLGAPTQEGVTDVEKLKQFENSAGSGFREGKWFAHDSLEGGTQSIAYGRKLSQEEQDSGMIDIKGSMVDWRQGLTQNQANDVFAKSTGDARDVAMASLVKVGMEGDQNKVDSLTSLIYNVGSGAWGESKAKAFLETGNVEDFMYEAFDSKVGFININGKPSRGLIRRRGEEATLFGATETSVAKEDSTGFVQMIQDTLSFLNPISTAEAHDLIETQGGAIALGSNYKVSSGDTLTGIAKKFGTTVEQLRDLNSDITDPNKIAVGQEILLTSPGEVPTASEPEPEPVRSPPTTTTTTTFNTETGVFDFFDADPTQTVEPSGSSSIPEPPSSVIAQATPPRKPEGILETIGAPGTIVSKNGKRDFKRTAENLGKALDMDLGDEIIGDQKTTLGYSGGLFQLAPYASWVVAANFLTGYKGIIDEGMLRGKELEKLTEITLGRIKKGQNKITYASFGDPSQPGYQSNIDLSPSVRRILKTTLGAAYIVKHEGKILIADEYDMPMDKRVLKALGTTEKKLRDASFIEKMEYILGVNDKKKGLPDVGSRGKVHRFGELFGPQEGDTLSQRYTLGTFEDLKLEEKDIKNIPTLEDHEKRLLKEGRLNPDNVIALETPFDIPIGGA